jgi:uncharacterized protein YqkB
MYEKNLPIQFFDYREGDEKPTEGGGGTDAKWLLPTPQLIKKSELLLAELNAFENIISKQEKKQSAIPFVCKAKLQEKATAKSRRPYVEKIINTSHTRSNIIGIVDREELVVRIDSLEELNTISQNIKDYERNIFGLSCLDRILPFEPKIIMSEKTENLKVKLLDFQDYNDNLAIIRLFEKVLKNNKMYFKRTEYAEAFPIYKIQGEQAVLLDVFKQNDVFEALFSIEPMPQYSLSLDSIPFEEALPMKKPSEDQKYATLGILDNGIARIPHLESWLAGERYTPYPEDKITPTHGTFTAGVALYGDELEGTQWVGHRGIKLLDAAVFPDTIKESLDEDELIENIKEVVRKRHEDVKIWNLSISVTRPILETDFSDLAKALDYVQEAYNVLICKSAGNCYNFLKGHPKGKLHEGADSVLSLVVGSIVHEKGVDDIAEVDNPSPFSRIGPGPEFIIKPELVHYGGNAGIKPDGSLSITGVKSFSIDGKLKQSAGTSFSTPRIAALATGLYQEIDQEFDPLLIKSMLIQSANYPDRLSVPYTERTKYVGFGKPPSVQEMLYNDPHEITLILRGTLIKGKFIEILDFPMPSCLIKDGFYTGHIIATLVYSPALEPSQGSEYCQSNINVLLGTFDNKKERDTTKYNILYSVGKENPQNIFSHDLYSQRRIKNGTGTFAQRERLLIQFADKYYPVKKWAVDLSELTDGNKKYITANKNWYLKLEGLYRRYTELKAVNTVKPQQEFCLIITIKDPTEKLNVYNETIQKLDALNFWHNSLNISSRVSVRN